MIQKLTKLSFFITALLTLGMATVPVYAVPAATGHGSAVAQAHEASQATTHGNGNATSAADRAQRQCQVRQKNIKMILGHLTDRGQRQTDLFSTIATRVENFAATKNDKPANYDTLVSAVDTQKASAQATVDAIKSDSTNFTCNSTTPKAVSASIKADLQKEIQALKDYRTAVKNLTVGIKSVADNTSTSTGGSN
jgi:hypothetical protein